MRLALFLLVIAFSAPAAWAETGDRPEANEPNLPLCLKTDTVKWWENSYCRLRVNTGDAASPAFRKCLRQNQKSKTLPRTTCKRIQWLKARTCKLWKLGAAEYTECLREKGFVKKVSENPARFSGG